MTTPTRPTSQAERRRSAPDVILERMKRQFLQEELLAETLPLAQLSNVLFHTSDYFEEYITVYLAKSCIDQQDPSVQGFREYIQQIIYSGGTREALALQAINQIKALTNESRPCLQPYVAPVSMLDAGPAIGLYAVYAESQGSPLFRDGIRSAIRGQAAKWINGTGNDQPFITWLCGPKVYEC